jgi:hypothetical protein
MPRLGITRIENLSLESVKPTLVTCDKGCHSLVTREVTAFDTRTRVGFTASRDRFFNPCNPKSRHCYNPKRAKNPGVARVF